MNSLAARNRSMGRPAFALGALLVTLFSGLIGGGIVLGKAEVAPGPGKTFLNTRERAQSFLQAERKDAPSGGDGDDLMEDALGDSVEEHARKMHGVEYHDTQEDQLVAGGVPGAKQTLDRDPVPEATDPRTKAERKKAALAKFQGYAREEARKAMAEKAAAPKSRAEEIAERMTWNARQAGQRRAERKRTNDVTRRHSNVQTDLATSRIDRSKELQARVADVKPWSKRNEIQPLADQIKREVDSYVPLLEPAGSELDQNQERADMMLEDPLSRPSGRRASGSVVAQHVEKFDKGAADAPGLARYNFGLQGREMTKQDDSSDQKPKPKPGLKPHRS